MSSLLSVNIGTATPSHHSEIGVTGIDKRPVNGRVAVRAPGPRGTGGSGLLGDTVCDLRVHGGDDRAVYAYAREDLDRWSGELGQELPDGAFGENLTTAGLSVTGALIGERWQIGAEVVLEVSAPRLPNRTFAGWLGERGWEQTFTERGLPGAYLRVVRPGFVEAGDPVTVVYRPDHDVTIGLVFRALTREAGLLPRLRRADALPEEVKHCPLWAV
jgi:MOSC domain-containing protein YiiM